MSSVKDIPENISTAISVIKSFAKYLVIPTGVIMIAPDDWLVRFRLLDIKNNFGQWVAIVFWIVTSIIIVDLAQNLIKKALEKTKQKKLIKSLEKLLDNLNQTEWEMVLLIYMNDAYSFQCNDASVKSLTSQKIIFSPNTSQEFFTFSYTLQPWVRDYLKKHPQLVFSFRAKKAKSIHAQITALEQQQKSHPYHDFSSHDINNEIMWLRNELAVWEEESEEVNPNEQF